MVIPFVCVSGWSSSNTASAVFNRRFIQHMVTEYVQIDGSTVDTYDVVMNTFFHPESSLPLDIPVPVVDDTFRSCDVTGASRRSLSTRLLSDVVCGVRKGACSTIGPCLVALFEASVRQYGSMGGEAWSADRAIPSTKWTIGFVASAQWDGELSDICLSDSTIAKAREACVLLCGDLEEHEWWLVGADDDKRQRCRMWVKELSCGRRIKAAAIGAVLWTTATVHILKRAIGYSLVNLVTSFSSLLKFATLFKGRQVSFFHDQVASTLKGSGSCLSSDVLKQVISVYMGRSPVGEVVGEYVAMMHRMALDACEQVVQALISMVAAVVTFACSILPPGGWGGAKSSGCVKGIAADLCFSDTGIPDAYKRGEWCSLQTRCEGVVLAFAQEGGSSISVQSRVTMVVSSLMTKLMNMMRELAEPVDDMFVLNMETAESLAPTMLSMSAVAGAVLSQGGRLFGDCDVREALQVVARDVCGRAMVPREGSAMDVPNFVWKMDKTWKVDSALCLVEAPPVFGVFHVCVRIASGRASAQVPSRLLVEVKQNEGQSSDECMADQQADCLQDADGGGKRKKAGGKSWRLPISAEGFFSPVDSSANPNVMTDADYMRNYALRNNLRLFLRMMRISGSTVSYILSFYSVLVEEAKAEARHVAPFGAACLARPWKQWLERFVLGLAELRQYGFVQISASDRIYLRI